MPCFSPLQAWRGSQNESGKYPLVFKKPGGFAVAERCPCGQCVGCRLDYSLDWATRCICESQMHLRNCFITLTFDDVHLPSDKSLDKREFQLFMKKFRKRVGVPLRYFHSGEYGEKLGRPHYHALIFGYDFPDRVYLKTTDSGMKIFTSEILSSIWGNGHCSVGDVTFESAAYVARYCMKKITATEQVKDSNGIVIGRNMTQKFIDTYVDKATGVIRQPEYVTMSRRPGIAWSWFQKFQSDVYPSDYLVVRKGIKMPPPRYFDVLYEVMNSLDLKRLKMYRIERSRKIVDGKDDNDLIRLGVKEEVKLAQIKLLSRSLEG